MHTSTRLVLLAALVATAACGAKPQPEQPLPQQQNPATQPSVNADSVRRAQEEADRRRRLADSLAAAARDSAARVAATANAATAAARAEAARMFADQIHFDYDKFDIRPEDQALLDWKARILLANVDITVRISGHADDRGSDEYNLALGNRRAAAAKRYLLNKGVAEGRIVIDSYGEERPLDTGATEEAWAVNRRAEFAITAAPAIWSLPTP
ncbi:MAG: OmpA family protein [Gemmatimonadota bacterium]